MKKPRKPVKKLPPKKGLSNPKAAKGAAASSAKGGNRSMKGSSASAAKGGNRYSKGNKNRPLPMKKSGRGR